MNNAIHEANAFLELTKILFEHCLNSDTIGASLASSNKLAKPDYFCQT